MLWGQHDVGYIAFYEFFRRIGLEQAVAPLAGLVTIARSAGWWWPHRGFAVLTDRPELVRLESRDGRRQLHCEDGPAVRYRDGFAVYSWHGTRVPTDMIEGDGWTTDRILRESNVEVRRCAIERMGWDDFAKAARLRVVHEATDPGNPGQKLQLCDVPSDIFGTPVRVLLCTNGSPERDGTRRRFGLTVPAELDDAVSAAAWTYNLDKKQYAQLARRT